MPIPVQVLSGVPFEQAKRAIALLRDAGIPVNVRRVVAARWVYVAAVDEEPALKLLAAHRFPAPMARAGESVVVRQATRPAPGDDVWSLLTEQEQPWPSVYSFP